MSLVLGLLAVVSLLEVLLWLSPLWRFRKVLICGLIPVLSVLSGLLFGDTIAVWTGLLLVLSIYRIINLLRVLENRLQATQLYRISRRTSYWLIMAQAVTGGITALVHWQTYHPLTLWYLLAALQLVAAFVLLLSTERHLRTTTPPQLGKKTPDDKLSTLSVLIPARNETDDLERCLESLVSSDYPKLEIIVLDDCSQNRHTPAIIKDYAHAGVRFIAGKPPAQHWLAKNWAYQQLTEQANGELLLFCGVDARFQPGSLRAMVETLRAKHKQMSSWIPRNQLPGLRSLQALLVQPARYAWELTPPRRLFQRPPVLSTAWLISRPALEAAGGFPATMNSVGAESYFARHTAHHGDGYSFLQSSPQIGLTSAKSLAAQRATAVRVRYPQLHRRPEVVAAVSLLELAVLLLPFAVIIIGIINSWWLLAGLAAVAVMVQLSIYARIVALTYRRFLWRGLWTLPLAVLYDIALLNYSMWQYEFREVIWKGRNVCLPVLRTAPTTNSAQRH